MLFYNSKVKISTVIMIFSLLLIINLLLLINNCNQKHKNSVENNNNNNNDNENEGFTSNKIKELSDKNKMSERFKDKLRKRRKGNTKEKFKKTENTNKSFRDDIYDYYKSFKKTALGKWSNNTKESFSKIQILKDKLYEII